MPENFDLPAFERKVLRHVEHIQILKNEAEPFYQSIRSRYPSPPELESENSGLAKLVTSGLLKFIEITSSRTSRGLREHRVELTRRAEDIAGRQDVRTHLCPALQGVESEPLAIAKVITPILAPLAGAKISSMSLDAELFAMLSLVIANRSVAAYCVSY